MQLPPVSGGQGCEAAQSPCSSCLPPLLLLPPNRGSGERAGPTRGSCQRVLEHQGPVAQAAGAAPSLPPSQAGARTARAQPGSTRCSSRWARRVIHAPNRNTTRAPGAPLQSTSSSRPPVSRGRILPVQPAVRAPCLSRSVPPVPGPALLSARLSTVSTALAGVFWST